MVYVLSSIVFDDLRWHCATYLTVIDQLKIVDRQKAFKTDIKCRHGPYGTYSDNGDRFSWLHVRRPLGPNLYFKRRTGLMAEDVDADALKKSLKRSKKVKSQDTMSIESWKSTSSRGEKMHVKNACINDQKFRNSNWRKNPVRHSKRRNRSSKITQYNSFYYLSVLLFINSNLFGINGNSRKYHHSNTRLEIIFSASISSVQIVLYLGSYSRDER